MTNQGRKLTVLIAFFITTLVIGASGATLRGTVKIKKLKRKQSDIVVCLKPKGSLDIKLPETNPVMGQRRLEFTPKLLLITVGSTVEFLNNDVTNHNLFSPSKVADKFNFGSFPPGDKRSHTFDKVGVTTLLCDIHDEMRAFIYICDSHLVTKTNRKGEYSIDNVPPGEYEMKVWHRKKKRKFKKDISVGKEDLEVNVAR